MQRAARADSFVVYYILRGATYNKGLEKEVGGIMDKKNLAYCNECEDLVEFEIRDEVIEEQYKGEIVRFKFRVGHCRECDCEVATDIDYNARKSKKKIEAYKKLRGIILEEEISEILEKYDVGKEALADIAGFGKATVKRYFEGFIPSKEYSDILVEFLNDEESFYLGVEKNKDKLKMSAYNRIISRNSRLKEIANSKIDQVVNYIIVNLGEVTPLALEKLLAFSNGVNYAVNGKQLLSKKCQAWQHGYVYPYIYNKYKKYKFNPIDNGIKSTHGCMLSKLSKDEIKAIDMVINTFGLYSPKTLEMISHSQTPWLEKRVGYRADEAGNEIIDELSMKKFFVDKQLNTEERIMLYIMDTLKSSYPVDNAQ